MASDLLLEAETLVEEFCAQLDRLLQQSRQQQDSLETEARQIRRLLDELDLRLRLAGEGAGFTPPDTDRLRAEQEEAARREQELLALLPKTVGAGRRLELLLRQVRMSGRSLRSAEHLPPYDPWELALRSQVLYGREQERSALAREVHDGPAQVLSNVVLGLGRAWEAGSPEELQALIEGLLRDARLGLQEVRRFIYELRPSPLAEEALDRQIERYIRDLEAAYQIEVDFRWALPPRELSAEETIAIYRIVQEALQNARRHSRAERIFVESYVETPAWVVRVSDNGTGFDFFRAWEQKDHWGIRGMEERAHLIGAELRIESRPGYGTTITLALPLRAPDTAEGRT